MGQTVVKDERESYVTYIKLAANNGFHVKNL